MRAYACTHVFMDAFNSCTQVLLRHTDMYTHTHTHTHTTQVARNPASVLYPPDLWRRLNQEHEQGQIDPASAGFPAIHPPPKLGTLATPLTVTLELAELEKAFHDSALRTSAYLDSAPMANGTNHKPASEQEPPDLWPLANEPPKTYLVPSNGTQAYLGPTKDRVGTVALGEVPSVDWLRSEAAKESPRDPCYPRTSRPLGVNAAADASRAAPGGRSPREREIGCLLETKGSSCRKSQPKYHPATSDPGDARGTDAMRWTLREYGTSVVMSSAINQVTQ